jgi:hypothetical protein
MFSVDLYNRKYLIHSYFLTNDSQFNYKKGTHRSGIYDFSFQELLWVSNVFMKCQKNRKYGHL